MQCSQFIQRSISLLENLFEVVSFDIVTDELPQITQCMGNTGHCYTLTGRNLSDNTNKRVHTLHTQAAAHQCLRVHWPRAMTSWRLLSDSHTHLMRKVNMHAVTVCVFGICCIVPCVLLSPPSLYFLVFNRLSNDVVQVRHWWFGWGGIFIRTLPIFNGELILGSVSSGLRAPGSLLRPMIKLKLIVETIDYYHLF